MANKGNKKVRHVKNVGSVYFDNTTSQWTGQVENGKYANGRVKYKRFYSTSQEDVILKMKEFIKKTQLIDQDKTDTNLILVKDFFENYLVNIKKAKLKPTSYTRDCLTCRSNILPYIGEYYLTDLNTKIIQNELINALLAKGYSHSTIHKAYILTNECLRYAYKQEIIPKNPCDFVEEPQKKIFSQTKDIRFFNDEEIQDFKLAALTQENGTFVYNNGLALVSLIYTGLRSGELLALKWKDIDFENNYIKVHSNIAVFYNENSDREVVVQDGTKTRKSRIVHMTKSASKYLSELKELRNPKASDYVVITKGVRDSSSLKQTYLLICKRANINNPQGLHTLRHTFASLMIRKGVDIKIISEMLGHASVSFTYNTYVHLIEEEKAKIIKQIDV